MIHNFKKYPGLQILFFLAVFFLLTVAFTAAADVSWIPADRLIRWNPGVPGGIPDVPVVDNAAKYGLANDGSADVSSEINRIISQAAKPGAILLPAGTYLLKSGIRLKSGIVLRGEGPEKTRLIINSPRGIEITGSLSGREVPVKSGFSRNSKTLTLTSAGDVNPGQTIWLYCDNDPDLMYTKKEWNVDWAPNSIGQVIRVIAAEKERVEIDVPLRLDYRTELNPRIRVINPIENAGLENLSIKRLDQSEDNIVSIYAALSCWIRNCEMEYCTRSHVMASLSRFLTVEGSYFHHAYNYGGGGHGYGVVLVSSASDCLVTNNVFRTLRHAMMVQTGANGNVFSYNVSTDNFLLLADVSIHGHYSYANLFEGNVVQFIHVADFWGPTGPKTTFFRNRVCRSNIVISDHSNWTNVIGNTVRSGGIRVDRTVRNCLVEGNLIDHRMVWNNFPAQSPLPASFYLSGPPVFWGKQIWPCIGADVDGRCTGNPEFIPAQQR